MSCITSDPIDYPPCTSKTPCASLAASGRKMKQPVINNGEYLDDLQSTLASVVSPSLSTSTVPAAALVLSCSYSLPNNQLTTHQQHFERPGSASYVSCMMPGLCLSVHLLAKFSRVLRLPLVAMCMPKDQRVLSRLCLQPNDVPSYCFCQLLVVAL